MGRVYEPQMFRPNRHKPHVIRGTYHGWVVRGYDRHNIFHNKTVDTWPEALDLANDWATGGYPDPSEDS